jgi:hypothetical protein
MEPSLIACPQCQWPVTAAAAATGTPVPCPRCATAFTVTLFPALFRDAEGGRVGEPTVDEAQAACFFHAARKAVVACAACGRFLCELCDLPDGNRHVCPLCLGSDPAGGPGAAAASCQPGTVLYDNIALALALWPLLLVFPTLITAPAALFVVVRYWGRTAPPLPRSRGRFILAALLALAEIGAWVTAAAFWLGR